MAALGEVLVAELMTMSVEELRSRRVIKLKDPENMTDEHLERLKLLVNGLDESRALDLAAVNEKLCKLTEAAPLGYRSRLSLSPTPDANDPVFEEECRQEFVREEIEAYHDLIQDGARPTHRPDEESGSGYLSEIENPAEIISYWISLCHGVESILSHQRWRWDKFRKHQDWRRWRYWKSIWFERFVEQVREYRRKKGLEGDIRLLQDRKEQSKLQDWAEFQYWEYTRADRFVKQMEQATKDTKASQDRIQAAIEAGETAEQVEQHRELDLYIHRARIGTAKRELQRHAVLLKWIDEQLPIVASECQESTLNTHVPNDNPSPLATTSLGKRKRPADQTDHKKDSRRRVEFAESSDGESASVKTADAQDSTLANPPENEVPRPPNAEHERGRNSPETGPADDPIHTLDVSEPVRHESSPKRTKSLRRTRAGRSPVRTPTERRSTRASSKTSGLRQQPAATPAEEGVALQKPHAQPVASTRSSKRRISTALSANLYHVRSSRVSKARGRVRTQMLPETVYGDDTLQSSRKYKQPEKTVTPRDGTNLAKRKRTKQPLADAPLRRSRRLEERPKICYSM